MISTVRWQVGHVSRTSRRVSAGWHHLNYQPGHDSPFASDILRQGNRNQSVDSSISTSWVPHSLRFPAPPLPCFHAYDSSHSQTASHSSPSSAGHSASISGSKIPRTRSSGDSGTRRIDHHAPLHFATVCRVACPKGESSRTFGLQMNCRTLAFRANIAPFEAQSVSLIGPTTRGLKTLKHRPLDRLEKQS